MKLRYTCVIYLLLFSICSFGQPQERKSSTGTSQKTTPQAPGTTPQLAPKSPITGVWRGFFTSGSGFFQEKYKYEVQIGQLINNGIKGVTYSYKTTVFYGKANLAGMYTPSSKEVILKENKLLEVKMAGGSDACLMTCYLEYTKVGQTEVLEGTFTSVNTQRNTDCGSGRVYLEKVPESDFYKEDFVKEYETMRKNPAPRVTVVVPKKDPVITKTTPGKNNTAVNRNPVKRDNPVVKNNPTNPTVPNSSGRKTDNVVIKPIEEPKPIAKELKERDKAITKVIQAEGDEILIDLYDNGQIDDDTITVYHNNQVVAWKKRLCHQPISIRVKVDPRHPRNEFVMVADNLGSIPPNTALMRITVGKQQFEVFLTSTEQRNAVVIIDCKVPSRDTK